MPSTATAITPLLVGTGQPDQTRDGEEGTAILFGLPCKLTLLLKVNLASSR